MKSLVSIVVALGLAVAIAAPAFAGTSPPPNTKEACEAAGMHWDDNTKTCHPTGDPKN
jgi:hypothetical protein